MCRHMADPNRHVPLFVERLSLHVGSREDAIECARRDLDQYVVRSVTAWKGNPLKRKSMKFWVEYDDGDSMWLSWKADLVACQQYQDFIHSLEIDIRRPTLCGYHALAAHHWRCPRGHCVRRSQSYQRLRRVRFPGPTQCLHYPLCMLVKILPVDRARAT